MQDEREEERYRKIDEVIRKKQRRTRKRAKNGKAALIKMKKL